MSLRIQRKQISWNIYQEPSFWKWDDRFSGKAKNTHSFYIPDENGTGSVCRCQRQPVGNMLERWSPIPADLEHGGPVLIKTLVKTEKLNLG